jgi:hypothetical protein
VNAPRKGETEHVWQIVLTREGVAEMGHRRNGMIGRDVAERRVVVAAGLAYFARRRCVSSDLRREAPRGTL